MKKILFCAIVFLTSGCVAPLVPLIVDQMSDKKEVKPTISSDGKPICTVGVLKKNENATAKKMGIGAATGAAQALINQAIGLPSFVSGAVTGAGTPLATEVIKDYYCDTSVQVQPATVPPTKTTEQLLQEQNDLLKQQLEAEKAKNAKPVARKRRNK